MPGHKVSGGRMGRLGTRRNENRLLTLCVWDAQVWAVALACVAAVACAGIALVGTGSTAGELLQRRVVEYQPARKQGLQQQPNYQVPQPPPAAAPPPPSPLAPLSPAAPPRALLTLCAAAGPPRSRGRATHGGAPRGASPAAGAPRRWPGPQRAQADQCATHPAQEWCFCVCVCVCVCVRVCARACVHV